MNTLFLLAILLILSVAGYHLSKKYWWDIAEATSIVLIALFSIFLVAWFLILSLAPQREIYIFNSHKAHIESLVPNDIENAGSVVIKSEQNDWLFGAQYSRKRFGDWSIYPESVLELKPIK